MCEVNMCFAYRQLVMLPLGVSNDYISVILIKSVNQNKS